MKDEQEKQQETIEFLEGLIKEWERLLKAHASTGVGIYAFDRHRKEGLRKVLTLIEHRQSQFRERIKEKNQEISDLKDEITKLKLKR